MKHGKETLQLLEVIHLPEEVAVIHCSAQQRYLNRVLQGNN
jgi:hypothetical protein